MKMEGKRNTKRKTIITISNGVGGEIEGEIRTQDIKLDIWRKNKRKRRRNIPVL